MKTEYFSMQGRVYIGKRNPDGSRAPARWVYDSSVLETKQSVTRDERQESWSGSRGVAATMNTKKSMTIGLTLGQLNSDIAAIALDGVRVDIAAGSATGEPIGNVVAGDVIALAFADVSALALVDGTTPTPVALVENTDYTLNAEVGVLTFLTAKTGVVATGYDYAAHSLVTAFSAANEDHYILFAGLNTVDGATMHCRGEIYNVTMDPAETFGLIQPTFGDLTLSGTAKLDPFRQQDPKWGPYGRLFLIDSAA